MERVVYSLFPDEESVTADMHGSVITQIAQDGTCAEQQKVGHVMHGSTITQTAQDEALYRGICYVNRLITPGNTLMRWQSCPPAQGSCRQPQLPPPPRGQAVRILAQMRDMNPGDVYLQVEFLDRRGGVIGAERIENAENPIGREDAGKKRQTAFGDGNSGSRQDMRGLFHHGAAQVDVPTDAFHWRFRLIQSGPGELWFHHIDVVLREEEESWDRNVVFHPEEGEACCRLLIPELSRRTNRLQDPEIMTERANLVTMPLSLASSACVDSRFRPEDAGTEESIRKFLRERTAVNAPLVLLTSGPASRRAAETVRELCKDRENVTEEES